MLTMCESLSHLLGIILLLVHVLLYSLVEGQESTH